MHQAERERREYQTEPPPSGPTFAPGLKETSEEQFLWKRDRECECAEETCAVEQAGRRRVPLEKA